MPDVPCYTQKIADVNGPAAAKSDTTGKVSALETVRAKLHPFAEKTR